MEKGALTFDLVTHLRKELQRAGSMPDYDTYIRSISHVNKMGEQFWNVFKQTRPGSYVLKKIVSGKWTIKEGDIIRISGFGMVLTDYFIKPFAFTDEKRKALAHCGAMANLIVTLFDFMADSEGFKKNELLEHVLFNHTTGKLGKVKRLVMLCTGGSDQRLLLSLIKEYFTHIREVVGETKDLSPFYNLIRKMYLAEKQTLVMPDRVTEAQWTRKSVLPFLVMAVPAWISGNLSRKELVFQIRWFYKFGRTIGYVDDCVDYEQDVKCGAPNILVIRKMCSKSNSDDELMSLVTRIASDIQDLQFVWKQLFTGPVANSEDCLPSVVVASWIGGPQSKY